MNNTTTLEQDISNALSKDFLMKPHYHDMVVERMAAFIRERDKQKPRWVKASERMPEEDGLYFIKHCGIYNVADYDRKSGFYKDDEGYLFTPQIEWLDESLPSPQPDAEKDQRIQEFSKECEDRKNAQLYLLGECAKKENKIQQLESQLQDNKRWMDEAKQVFDNVNFQEVGKELGIPLGEIISNQILPKIRELKSQLQASKEIDTEKLFEEYHDNSHPKMMSRAAFIKAIQSIK